MNARDHARREDGRDRRHAKHDVAPVPDALACARRVPGGHRGDELRLRAALSEPLRTPTGPLAARALEQSLRKQTGDVEEPVDALPDSLERRRDGAVQHA